MTDKQIHPKSYVTKTSRPEVTTDNNKFTITHSNENGLVALGYVYELNHKRTDSNNIEWPAESYTMAPYVRLQSGHEPSVNIGYETFEDDGHGGLRSIPVGLAIADDQGTFIVDKLALKDTHTGNSLFTFERQGFRLCSYIGTTIEDNAVVLEAEGGYTHLKSANQHSHIKLFNDMTFLVDGNVCFNANEVSTRLTNKYKTSVVLEDERIALKVNDRTVLEHSEDNVALTYHPKARTSHKNNIAVPLLEASSNEVNFSMLTDRNLQIEPLNWLKLTKENLILSWFDTELVPCEVLNVSESSVKLAHPYEHDDGYAGSEINMSIGTMELLGPNMPFSPGVPAQITLHANGEIIICAGGNTAKYHHYNPDEAGGIFKGRKLTNKLITPVFSESQDHTTFHGADGNLAYDALDSRFGTTTLSSIGTGQTAAEIILAKDGTVTFQTGAELITVKAIIDKFASHGSILTEIIDTSTQLRGRVETIENAILSGNIAGGELSEDAVAQLAILTERMSNLQGNVETQLKGLPVVDLEPLKLRLTTLERDYHEPVNISGLEHRISEVEAYNVVIETLQAQLNEIDLSTCVQTAELEPHLDRISALELIHISRTEVEKDLDQLEDSFNSFVNVHNVTIATMERQIAAINGGADNGSGTVVAYDDTAIKHRLTTLENAGSSSYDDTAIVSRVQALEDASDTGTGTGATVDYSYPNKPGYVTQLTTNDFGYDIAAFGKVASDYLPNNTGNMGMTLFAHPANVNADELHIVYNGKTVLRSFQELTSIASPTSKSEIKLGKDKFQMRADGYTLIEYDGSDSDKPLTLRSTPHYDKACSIGLTATGEIMFETPLSGTVSFDGLLAMVVENAGSGSGGSNDYIDRPEYTTQGAVVEGRVASIGFGKMEKGVPFAPEGLKTSGLVLKSSTVDTEDEVQVKLNGQPIVRAVVKDGLVKVQSGHTSTGMALTDNSVELAIGIQPFLSINDNSNKDVFLSNPLTTLSTSLRLNKLGGVELQSDGRYVMSCSSQATVIRGSGMSVGGVVKATNGLYLGYSSNILYGKSSADNDTFPMLTGKGGNWTLQAESSNPDPKCKIEANNKDETISLTGVRKIIPDNNKSKNYATSLGQKGNKFGEIWGYHIHGRSIDVDYTISPSIFSQSCFIGPADSDGDSSINSYELTGEGNMLTINNTKGNTLIVPGTAGWLGVSSRRWDRVYVKYSTDTSDERLKNSIGVKEGLKYGYPEEWLDAWAKVSWTRFKMNDKGYQDSYHGGVIAQTVRDVFAEIGVDAVKETAILWLEDNGQGGTEYSVDYSHAQAIENAYQRRRMDAIEARLAKLEL